MLNMGNASTTVATTFEIVPKWSWKDFREAMIVLEDFYRDVEVMTTYLVYMANGNKEAIPVFGYSLMESHCEALSYLIGDKGDWVKWFVFENDFGIKKLPASHGRDQEVPRKIKNLRQLWDFMQEIDNP